MVGVTWKAKRSMSLTAGPGGGLRAASQPPQAVAAQPQEPPRPVITFKDKQSYQELFKPLPKPEPIPTLNIVQVKLNKKCNTNLHFSALKVTMLFL